jgi:glucan phosphoethanolaminetransferase (alkaline phosphatase superfamily)
MNFLKNLNWKKIAFNLLLGLFISFIFWTFSWMAIPKNFNWSNLIYRDNFLIVFLITFIGTFFTYRFRIFYYSFLLTLMYLEYLHITYYGNGIFAVEIWIFFSEFAEISEGIGSDMLSMFIVPSIVFISSLTLVIISLKLSQKKIISSVYLNYAFVLFFTVWPIILHINNRTIGSNPPNDQHIVRSGLETFAYFTGVILPKKLSKQNYNLSQTTPTPKPISKNTNNIVFLLGESLGTSRMQSFGYAIPTTPHIVNKLDSGIVNQRLCVAGGACTITSLSAMFNMIDSVGEIEQIISQNTALFKLAKKNGYKTYYLSVQSSQSTSDLNNILATRYVDVFKRSIEINPKLLEKQPTYDSLLIDELKKINLSSGKKFIVLHMYGSHENYQDRVVDADRIFSPEDYEFEKEAHYDNSVLYQDRIISLLTFGWSLFFLKAAVNPIHNRNIIQLLIIIGAVAIAGLSWINYGTDFTQLDPQINPLVFWYETGGLFIYLLILFFSSRNFFNTED